MWRMLRCARKVPAGRCVVTAFRTHLIGWGRLSLENASRFCSRPAVSLPSSSPRPTKPAQRSKPAHFRRRDFVLGCGALLVLGAVPGFRPPSRDASSLDDFMLVSQTISGAPPDRHVGLSCFSHLHRTDDRFIEHIQTLAWLVRRNPGLDGVGLVRLIDADSACDLRAALARLVDAWSARLDADPAWGDIRPLIVRASEASLSGS
ncbi:MULTISPECIES: hypothetical protein [Ralstonia]|mgnify:FL=1|jgi:hypothetical protein|nr:MULTISPECIES: hypothetical protein [Ralstonia]MBB0022640.1 hypothetical protein [Ralstonia pickettii]MBB0033197.1 hypothetical protein [Ralstonia pickettii]MBB0096274.1 hypothetical protein [Ralstonia pickettii]MBB0105665.1 hypothetical protein [Ralstonia pickettii]MBB0127309.1 hypothetical protein [Ralstonia pickettii]